LHEISAFDFSQANLHDPQIGGVNDPDNPTPIPDDSVKDDASTLLMMAALICLLF